MTKDLPMICLILWLAAPGCGDDGGPACADADCTTPPADQCLDDTTLRVHQETGSCDPDTGRCSYPRTERDCPDGCVHDTCLDLGGDRALLIPEGTRVCSDKRSSWDVFGGYHNRMRITFRGGVVRLPAEPAQFERDWIDTIEYGPERTLLESAGAGSFTRRKAAGRVEYRFVQPFSGGGEIYELTYDVWFDAADPDDRLRVFDEVYLSPPLEYPVRTIQLEIARGEYERWWFLTCRYLLYQPVLHRVATEDGAALELDERVFSNQDCMLACPTALRRAVFALGDVEREVSDPFRLSFVDGQHNWFDQFLVVFDEPVDDIHGLYYFPNDNQVPEPRVVFLDAALEEIRTTLVTSHHTVELWPAFNADDLAVESCEVYCRDHLGLAEGCEAGCPVEDQHIPGRCLASPDIEPGQNWTPLASCQDTFEACRQAGRPHIQCCCSRPADLP